MYNTIVPNESGGCRQLISYLEKEESLSRDFAEYLDKESDFEKDFFFNDQERFIEKDDVVAGIDRNCKGLKLNESRFFSMTLNPSAKEIAHLEKLADIHIREYQGRGVDLTHGGVVPIQDVRDSIVRDMLKDYAIEGMNKYAQNFGREKIQSGKDLVWYGRIEKDRYWKYTSKEVQHNKKIERRIAKLERMPRSRERDRQIKELRKDYILESQVRKGGKDIPIREMMPKSGKNYHVHIVVSRRDRTQSMSLSPLAKARGNDQHIINSVKCKIGFDRNNFTQQLESSFDRIFGYERQFFESYIGKKTMKENPELYKVKEAEYNAEKGIQKEIRGTDIEKSNKPKLEGKGAIRGFTDRAGLSEVREEIKPYRNSAKLGYQGYKLVLSGKGGRRQLAKISATASKQVARGMGLSAVGNVYLAAASIGIGFVSELTKSGE